MGFDISDLSSGEFQLEDELELDDSTHWQREHFIPIRKSELIGLLCGAGELSAAEQAEFSLFCKLLDAVVHHQYHRRLERLKDVYAAFDPDSDTRECVLRDSHERDQLSPLFFKEFTRLLERANYERVTQEEIEQALVESTDWGVNLTVDFDVFERLEIYARGDIVGRRTRRKLRNAYREEEVEVPIYQRLILVFRLNDKIKDNDVDTETIYIKLFKNIPKMDLDMLLPGSRVRMTWLDQTKIFVPSLTGMVLSIIKLLQAGLFVALSGFYGMLAFLGLVGGTIGYGVRSFFGYLSTKDKHQLNLTRSLYYQNLDNNAGVIYRMLDSAEEQEMREVILSYYLLWKQAPRDGWTARKIDAKAESLIRRAIDFDVDFEIQDAIAKLRRLRLVEPVEGNRWRAVPISVALQQLQSTWQNVKHRNPASRAG